MAMKAVELKILENGAEHPVVEVAGIPVLLRTKEIQGRLILGRAILAEDRIVVALFRESPEVSRMMREERTGKERWLEFFGACENYPDTVSGFDLRGARIWKIPAFRHEGQVVTAFHGLSIGDDGDLIAETWDGMCYRIKNVDTGEIEIRHWAK